ncbi:MAG: hypothetical protein IJ864_01080 [Alphaproteobacteria bacterium]|nr:hypothetical protein [Alphaproteobacteria bacterium]
MACLTSAAAQNLPLIGKLSQSAARLTAFVGLAIPSIRGALGDMVNTSYYIKSENLRNSVRSDTQFNKIKELWEEYPMLFVKGNNHEELKAAIQTLSQEKGKILSQSSWFTSSAVSYAIAAGVIAYNNPAIAAMSMTVSAASGYAFSKAMRFFDKSAQKLKNKSTRYTGVMGDVMQHLGLVKQNNIADMWKKALIETRMAESTLDGIHYYLDSNQTEIAQLRMKNVINKIKSLSDENTPDISSEKGIYLRISKMLLNDKVLQKFYLETVTYSSEEPSHSNLGKSDKTSPSVDSIHNPVLSFVSKNKNQH